MSAFRISEIPRVPILIAMVFLLASPLVISSLGRHSRTKPVAKPTSALPAQAYREPDFLSQDRMEEPPRTPAATYGAVTANPDNVPDRDWSQYPVKAQTKARVDSNSDEEMTEGMRQQQENARLAEEAARRGQPGIPPNGFEGR